MPSVRLKRNAVVAALVLLGGLLMLETARAQEKSPASEPAVDMQWAVKIPARDGIKLNATVFTPHEQKDPLPVIFTFTPYTDRAVYFARHGYV